jgi:hypothetical protein
MLVPHILGSIPLPPNHLLDEDQFRKIAVGGAGRPTVGDIG